MNVATMGSDVGSMVYEKERPLFLISVGISVLVWLVVVVGTVGVALLYVLLFFLLYLFAQSAFISYLKGNGVRISPEQFPDLHAHLLACANRLGMPTPPDAYLVHANGAFNALATRFLGHNFIVLYSDIVDALKERPGALKFYIGHELGHIHRKHLKWGPWLWPAGILPLLGAAYSRAREYTCDLHGLACCDSEDDAIAGLSALAAGGERWKTINRSAYAAQTADTGGFWMSFHELTGDYPWLVKRSVRLQPQSGVRVPGRHGLAWLLALFIPRLGVGGGGLVMVAMIGILVAVAIPAYQDYTIRARVSAGLMEVPPFERCVVAQYRKSKTVPRSNADCGYKSPDSFANGSLSRIEIGDGGSVIVTYGGKQIPSAIQGATIKLVPSEMPDGSISWSCAEGTLPMKYRPLNCRR